MPQLILILLSLIVVSGGSNIVLSYDSPQPSQPSVIKGAAIRQAQKGLPQLAPFPRIKDSAEKPIVDAQNVSVLDLASGQFLYQKNASAAVPVASLTKVMTAIVVVEEGNLEKEIEISQNAAAAAGSDILLRPSEKLKKIDLLKGLLINSGNDAAAALAEDSGGADLFVEKMNNKTLSLGLKNTRFNDPAGLDDKGYSSASDLAIITAYALRYQVFKDIIATAETTISSTDLKITHKLENSNRLVKQEMHYPGVIGGKTGFTPISGHSMLCAVARNGHTIITIVINTSSPSKEASAVETRKALDWTFDNVVWSQ